MVYAFFDTKQVTCKLQLLLQIYNMCGIVLNSQEM